MRSDFLGECDAFQGLPEAMNTSQYLVPRLTRHQRREAILGPIRLAGADITPRLTDRLLNESLDTRDDLPVLQHVLMQTCTMWAKDGKGPIDLEHYEKSGTIQHALSLHADEALAGLSDESLAIAKRMFQALTETDASNRRIRRPANLHEIVAVCGKKEAPETVMSLITRFNADHRNFLVISPGATEDNPLLDISHESLIRQWKTLAAWVDEEAESARVYRRLAESAKLHAGGKAGYYRDADLQVALDWQRQQQPNAEWAGRYHPEFELAVGFLKQSINKQKTNRSFVTSLLVCAYLCIYSWLTIKATDDVSLATNSTLLPIIGTRMPADQVYLVLPLLLCSVYAYFLFYLQRLLLMLAHQPAKISGGTILDGQAGTGGHVCAGLVHGTDNARWIMDVLLAAPRWDRHRVACFFNHAGIRPAAAFPPFGQARQKRWIADIVAGPEACRSRRHPVDRLGRRLPFFWRLSWNSCAPIDLIEGSAGIGPLDIRQGRIRFVLRLQRGVRFAAA